MRGHILAAVLLLATIRDVLGGDGCSQCCPPVQDCCCCQGTVRCGQQSGGGCPGNGCFSTQRASPGCQLACSPQACPSPPPCGFCPSNSGQSSGVSACGSPPAPPPINPLQYRPYPQSVPPSPPAPAFNYIQPPGNVNSPSIPRVNVNINQYGRSPPGRIDLPASPPAPPPLLRSRRPRPPPTIAPQYEEIRHPEGDGSFYENDKSVGIPALDDGESQVSGLPTTPSSVGSDAYKEPETSTLKPETSAPQSPGSYESSPTEANIPISTSTEPSAPGDDSESPPSAPSSYKSIEQKLRIDKEPQSIDALESPPPTNEELLHEVSSLLEESKREAQILTQLVQELSAMNSVAKATNGESTRVQEGLPEVNTLEAGPPAFEDVDIAEETVEKKAHAARNYDRHPLVEKLEDELKLPIEVDRIELSTLLPSTVTSREMTSADPNEEIAPTPNTPISLTPTTFAATPHRFHEPVNFTDLLAREQTMVPPATTPPNDNEAAPSNENTKIVTRGNFYSLGFGTRNLMKNFLKAREEMRKRVTAMSEHSSPANKTRSRTLDMLLHQIKENREQKTTFGVMPVVKKLERQFAKTKAAKTHRQEVETSITTPKLNTEAKKGTRKGDKAISRTTRTPPTTTTTTTTMTTTVTSSMESSESPAYVNSDVEVNESFKLDGDTSSGTPEGMLVDSDAPNKQKNAMTRELRNFNSRKAFLEEILKELGTNTPEEHVEQAQKSTADEPFADVRVVGGQSRTTRKPSAMELAETSEEGKQSTPEEARPESPASRPVVRLRTTEFKHLDPQAISLSRQDKPFKVRVPSVRSQWDRQFSGSNQLSSIRRIPALQDSIDQ